MVKVYQTEDLTELALRSKSRKGVYVLDIVLQGPDSITVDMVSEEVKIENSKYALSWVECKAVCS